MLDRRQVFRINIDHAKSLQTRAFLTVCLIFAIASSPRQASAANRRTACFRRRGLLLSTPDAPESSPGGSSNPGGVSAPSLGLSNVALDYLGYFLRALTFEKIPLERHQVGGLQNAVGVEYGSVDSIEVAVTLGLHVLELQPTGPFNSRL